MDFQDDLTLGRGKVYFDRFADGTYTKTGEQFLGNCPQFQMTQNNTKLDHYRSTSGLKVKDRTVTLQNDLSGTIQTDNCSADNLALWFLGEKLSAVVVGGTPETDTFTVKLGTFLQLGVTDATPAGVRNVTAVTVKKGATDVAAAGNYEVDLKKGRIYIEPDATDIDDADSLSVTFTPSGGTSTTVLASGKMVFGALRFIADNPLGSDKDFYFPYVQLTSNGNLDLIADTWQTASFTVDALKLDDGTERLYITQ